MPVRISTGVNAAQRFALPAAGEKKDWKRETAIVQKQAQKTRRLPAVRLFMPRRTLPGCTLCWAALPIRLALGG